MTSSNKTSTTTNRRKKQVEEEEYTDYSCSTSMERLARDVETLLRSWHVDKGNDRHISASSSNKPKPKNQDNTKSSSNQLLLLRQDDLTWNVSIRTGGRPTATTISTTVELQLSLWDGPAAGASPDDATTSGLPHSLRRSATPQLPPSGGGGNGGNSSSSIFENLSYLFGIGQHITLTPKKITASGGGVDDVDLQRVLVNQSIQYRYNPQLLGSLVGQQILSNWLQTALNVAVANCQCCIPVFGIWGLYNTTNNTTGGGRGGSGELSLWPSWMQHLLYQQQQQQQQPRMMSKNLWNQIQQIQNQQSLPPLIQGLVLPTTTSSSTVDVLLQSANFSINWIPPLTTESNSSSSSSSSRPPRLTTWGNLLLEHTTDDTVVLWNACHKFGWWKQPMIKTTSVLEQLFQPDNYLAASSEHNPYTAWRRTTKTKRKQLTSKAKKPNVKVINLTSPSKSTKGEDDTTNSHNHNRTTTTSMSIMEDYYQQREQYEDQCRNLAITLLDQASGCFSASSGSGDEPRWGPIDDPIAAIHATVTWPGSKMIDNNNDTNSNSSSDKKKSENNDDESDDQNDDDDAPTVVVPLLSFPLRIRSQHSMSIEDWLEMEESVENTILNPQQSASTQFHIQTWWDYETSVASLAASQQCLLAALVRTSTLSDQTSIKHLTDVNVLQMWDCASGNVVAACLAQQAKVSAPTAALVDAMDWITSAEEKIDLHDAQILVKHIIQPTNGYPDFPSPPETPPTFDTTTSTTTSPRGHQGSSLRQHQRPLVEQTAAATSTTTASAQETSNSNNPFAPLFKSAPLGRLVSILCVHAARLRSPCSMAMLWIAFCHEIRIRWEHRLKLPLVSNSVPGLDPSPLDLKERNRCLTTLGVKADYAAYWTTTTTPSSSNNNNNNNVDSSSSSSLNDDGGGTTNTPDTEFPGDHHCLIGQKLQVVNLCIDMITAVEEKRQKRQMEKRRKLDPASAATTTTTTTTNGGGASSSRVKITHENGEAVPPPPAVSVAPSSTNSDEGEDDDDDLYSLQPAVSDPSERFEDALSEPEDDDDDGDGGDPFANNNDTAAAAAAAAKRRMDLSIKTNTTNNQEEQQATTSVALRKGARCPVPGCSLVTNGDQLYAPYLQRPYPLTDDVIAERHAMLSRHHNNNNNNEPSSSSSSSKSNNQQQQHNNIYKRLEISYRLQKPKLLSDMCAFKAANPGSIFQDFVNWYGNPGNPLDDYSDTRSPRAAAAAGAGSGSGGGGAYGDLLLGTRRTSGTESSVAVKLDKAAEAIQMLNETREFWSRTWEEATPIPASDQKLLFDVTSTVEMALDFMENMHPAILINQIMAVNLAVAYFTLMGAAKEVGVLHVGGLVKRSYQRLREKTEHALELLAVDATNSTSSNFGGNQRHEGASNFVSISAISACDAACTALSEAEVLTARATSLLHKFPEQYELVESIIQRNPGEEINLKDPKAQSQVLSVIQQQQQDQMKKQKSSSKTNKATAGVQPAIREYVFRNLDDSNPCQLGVRYCDQTLMFNNSNSNSNNNNNFTANAETAAAMGGTIIALTKCQTE